MRWRSSMMLLLLMAAGALAAPRTGKIDKELAEKKARAKEKAGFTFPKRMDSHSTRGVPKAVLPDTLFEEHFDAASWHVEDLSADMTKGWHVTTRDAHSGTYSFWCGDEDTGEYPPGPWTSSITFGPIDLSSVSNPYLKFWHKFRRASYSYGDIYVSTDHENWTLLTYYSSSISDWQEEQLSLVGYAGKLQVWIRFTFFNNSSNTAEGWFIDDIAVVDVQETVHLSEDFESGVWPPTGWNVYKEGDAGSNGWQQETSSTYGAHGSPMGDYSAWHNDDNASCDDWLVSPQIDLTSASSPVLRFYERNYYMPWYWYHGVWISTGSGDPADGDFVELQEMSSSAYNWTSRTIDLSAYVGQQVYIAFRYQGNWATEWYIDNVSVVEITEDTLFYDDIESGDGNFVYGTGVMWNWVSDGKQGGGAYFSSDPALPHYLPGTFTSLEPVGTWLDLSGYENVQLSFWLKGGTHWGDYLMVYWVNSSGAYNIGGFYLPSGSDWTQFTLDVTDTEGYPRFVFFSDYDADVDTGVFIDDVIITGYYRVADYAKIETEVDTVRAGQTATFYSWVYEAELTPPDGPSGVTALAGYGTEGSIPGSKDWLEITSAYFFADLEPEVIVFQDDFDDGDLNGWTVVDGNGDSHTWECGVLGWLTLPWDYGTAYAFYNDDYAGWLAPPSDEELISPSISTESYDPERTYYLTYYWYNATYDEDDTIFTYIRIFSETKQGWGAWQLLAAHAVPSGWGSAWGKPDIDVTSYLASGDSVQIKFVYIDQGGWNYVPVIDEVMIYSGYPREYYAAEFTPTTTGTYDVAFGYSFNPGTAAEHWIFADLDGNDTGMGGTNGYEPEHAAKLVVLPSEVVGNITINDVADTIVAGTPVQCTVMVYDEYGNFKYDFNGWVHIGLWSGNPLLGTAKGDTIDSVEVENGVWTGSVSPIIAGPDAIIILYDGHADTTNWFTVVPAAVDTFVIDSIPNQLAGAPFDISARAYDAYGNFVSDFDGDVFVDDGTGTLHAAKGEDFSFSNGQLFATVIIDSPMVDDSIVITYSIPDKGDAQQVVGVSNKFTVVPNVVDYVMVVRPDTDTVTVGHYTEIYVVVYEAKRTPIPGPYRGIAVEAGIGPDGSDPSGGKTWVWTPMKYLKDTTINVEVNGTPMELKCDMYSGRIMGSLLGDWDMAARATFLTDTVWVYGDLDGNDMGLAGTNWYSPDQAAALTVLDNEIDRLFLSTSDTFEIRSGENTPYIYGKVLEGDYTNRRYGSCANIELQFGYGASLDPAEWPDTNWFDGVFFGNLGAYDIYRATLPVDGDSGEYFYTVRARFVYNGYQGPWLYGDLNGEPDAAAGYEGFGLIRVVGTPPDTSAPTWARLVYPRAMVLPTNTTTRPVIGRVYKENSVPEDIVAEVGYGTSMDDPESWDNWTQTGFYRNVRMRYGGSMVTAFEYRGPFVTPDEPGTYYYAYRFNYNGSEWLYADLDGADNGFNRPGYLYVYSWGVLAMPGDLEADVTAEGVVLRWRAPELASNVNGTKSEIIDSPDDLVFDHYEIYASDAEDGVYELVGETTEPVFVDRDVEKAGYRWYYVVAVYNDGEVESPSDGVLGVDLSRPTRFDVSSVWPNPARNEVAVRFALPHDTDVELTVYDATGRVVLSRQMRMEAGVHSWKWNLRNEAGVRVGAGVYFVRVQAGSLTVNRRVVVMK